jgi:hypothetical protein
MDFLQKLFCRKRRNRTERPAVVMPGLAREGVAWRSENWNEPMHRSEDHNRNIEIAEELDWFEN